MGIYLNTSNEGFCNATHGVFYIDKTGLLRYTNSKINTPSNCIAVSHARRFGKSQIADMLNAYYSIGCDSHDIFSKFEIACSRDFLDHLNRYNVIYIDISTIDTYDKEDIVNDIIKYLYNDFKNEFKNIDYSQNIAYVLMNIYKEYNYKFIVIIDEWDCVIRNHSSNKNLIHRYLQFLHNLFESKESRIFLALAYITGIMPIKKIDNESSNFMEFTMLRSLQLTEYFRFTEDEVKKICNEKGMDFELIKDWYDGYIINGKHIYNPNSVYQAIENGYIDSYWKETSSFETINDYITKGYMGLKEAIWMMVAGEKIRVNTDFFKNDLSQITTKDDALTALIHLGYLGYDINEGKAFIPNFEVMKAFDAALQETGWEEAKILAKSEELLEATLQENAGRVKELIDIAHDTYTDIITYNNEVALKCTVMMAYFSARRFYTLIPEFPTGKGYADIVFIPHHDAWDKPAIVVELTYDQSVDTAIKQIKERRYKGRLVGFSRKILLVGINYDAKKKEQQCTIEAVSI